MDEKNLNKFQNILRSAFQEMQSCVEKYEADGRLLGVRRDCPSFQGYRDNGMPRVGINWYFRDSPDYTTVFSLNDYERKTNLENLRAILELKCFVKETYEQFNSAPCFSSLDFRTDNGFWVLEVVILTMFDSYMHTKQLDVFDEGAFFDVFNRGVKRIFDATLPVSISVPILLVQIQPDIFEINNGVRIRKLSEKELVSVAYAFGPHSRKDESQLLTCATHAIEIHNAVIQNSFFFSESVFDFSEGYPPEIIDVIDLWFVSLQIVKHSSFGYGSIIAIPQGWGIREAGYIEIHGSKMQKFPESYLPKHWPNAPIAVVTTEELKQTARLFSFFFSNNTKSLSLAVQRLFWASLRENQEDAILDLVIGIEALVTGDEKGEITYKVSMRAAFVLSSLPEYPYSITQTRDAVKALYSFRSSVAHGKEPKGKDKIISISNEKKLPAVDLATELLRYLLLAMAHTPELLDVNKIDPFFLHRYELLSQPPADKGDSHK